MIEGDQMGALPLHESDGPDMFRGFPTTHWSMVLAAGRRSSPEAVAALQRLCLSYWYPLYAYVRRRGYHAHDSEDLIQGFFTYLLSGNDLARLDPARGRFRSFLLASLNHFLANEWRQSHRLKRGGNRAILSLDTANAETRYGVEPADEMTPEKVFEYQWAVALLDQTLARLRIEYEHRGKQALFDRLKGFLVGDEAAPHYADLAHQLSLSEAAIKMSVHRLRQRYRQILLEEIAQTVAGPSEVEEELNHLFTALTP
jgi:DNA-directed RNA polymerase specialized sigma24 family protein